MHQLKKELALLETVHRDGGERKEEGRKQGESGNKDMSQATWWTTVYVCVIWIETGVSTVSKRAQCRWGRRKKAKKKPKQCLFFQLPGSKIDMPVPYTPAVMSRMSAGTQASRHMGWVEAGKRPSAQWGRVIITQNDHATTEQKGEY